MSEHTTGETVGASGGYPINPERPNLSATLYITRSFHAGPNNRSPPTIKVVAQVIRTTENTVKPIADRTTSAQDVHMCKKLKLIAPPDREGGS
jgi:hypothetical protein